MILSSDRLPGSDFACRHYVSGSGVDLMVFSYSRAQQIFGTLSVSSYWQLNSFAIWLVLMDSSSRSNFIDTGGDGGGGGVVKTDP